MQSIHSRPAVYAALLSHLSPPPPFPRPWQFLAPAPDTFGAVADRARALADLTDRFGLDRLRGAGVVRLGRRGPRLAPALVRQGALLLAFRTAAGRDPFSVLTRRGCLAARQDPVAAARRDAATAEAVARGGVLFAAPDVRDVALLRALGLGATLSGGLRRLRLSGLLALQTAYDRPPLVGGRPAAEADDPDDLAFPDDDDAAGDEAAPATTGPPGLALVGWSPRRVTAKPSASLVTDARFLAGAEKHLGYLLPGVSVWQPAANVLENLRFRLRFKEKGPIALLLRASAEYDAFTLEHLAAVPPRPVGLAKAHAELVAAMGGDGPDDLTERAAATYRAEVERTLVGPLRGRAAQSYDPLIRAIGAQTAALFELIHAMSPYLAAQQARGLRAVPTGDGPPPRPSRPRPSSSSCPSIGRPWVWPRT